MLESRLYSTKSGNEVYVDGYFLTIDQLHKLIVDYIKDSSEDRISNDQLYILKWLNENEI